MKKNFAAILLLTVFIFSLNALQKNKIIEFLDLNFARHLNDYFENPTEENKENSLLYIQELILILDNLSKSSEAKLIELNEKISVVNLLKDLITETEKMQDSIENDQIDAAKDSFQSITLYLLKITSTLYFYYKTQNRMYFIVVLILAGFILILVAYLLFTHQRIEITEENLKISRRKELDSSDFSQIILEAQETERSRISHEIHDTVVQDMRTIRLTAELLNLNEEENLQKRDKIVQLSTNSINQLRNICYNLAPPELMVLNNQKNDNAIQTNAILNRSRLISSLITLCNQFETKTKISCPLNFMDNTNFGKITFQDIINIFRIVQEALTNIEKHAQASHVSVLIRNTGILGKTNVSIFITDDGVGIPKEMVNFRESGIEHLGLTSMKDRAAKLNGTLTIQSEPGDGTEIKLTFPVK